MPLSIQPCSVDSVAGVSITVAVWACVVVGLSVPQVVRNASNAIVPGFHAAGAAKSPSLHAAKRLGAKSFLGLVSGSVGYFYL